jgi:hypothetical protein
MRSLCLMIRKIPPACCIVVVIYVGINNVWHRAQFQSGTPKARHEEGLHANISRISVTGSRIIVCAQSAMEASCGVEPPPGNPRVSPPPPTADNVIFRP